MIQLKNAKVLPKDGKLLLIDAPEMPVRQENIYSSVDAAFADKEYTHEMELYYEALYKAPTWEIINGDVILQELWRLDILKDKSDTCHQFEDWQPEQGKLYDLPKGYTYKITCWPDCKDHCTAIAQENDHSCKNIVILIPQEKGKIEQKQIFGDLMKTDQEYGMYEETQDELFQELWHTFGLWNGVQKAKSKFKITRLC